MNRDRSLIINADGYGFTNGVNAGIVKTFESGLVTSTSCTPNFGCLGDVGAVQSRFPHVSFGIHFNLNVGYPCADPNRVSSLLGEDGRFLGSALAGQMMRGKVRTSEMETELSAQAAMLSDQDVRISHWDGHQNKHLWPVYFEVAGRVASRFGIKGIRSHRRLLYSRQGPLSTGARFDYYTKNPRRAVTHIGGRLRTLQAERKGFAAADRLITPGYADDSHKSMSAFWYTLADSLTAGISEVYCHPGYPDDLLRMNSVYTDQRADEVAVLTDAKLQSHYRSSGIRLLNFWDLQQYRGIS